MKGSKRDSERDYWSYRRAKTVRFRDRVILGALVLTGFILVIRLGDWWFRADNVSNPFLYVVLSLAFWYGVSRILVGWVNYLAIRNPVHKSAPDGLRVAIFTTSSPGEPLSMFEKTLAACARITYPHTTYLLDDTRDPRFREVAEKHGAVWLELVGLPGAKAGKINKALELTDEEFILVLDPDHIPFPEFFSRVLGHFRDPGVGFVQVSQGYYNQSRSFVARGAAEQTYSFYGPTLMGLFGHGASLAIGANCTFRREALDSINGHGIGLAEDLVTAIRLHAAGWRSVYVPEILSRGLVPEDLGSFFKQQLKWSRGVYEVLFSEIPRLFRGLSWRQRFSYVAIGTYYIFGVTTLIYMVIPFLYLWGGIQPAAMRFAEFVVVALPVAFVGIAIYQFVQRWLCDPATEKGMHLIGLILKVACWPIYLMGTLLAIVRADIPYIPTSKEAVRGQFFRLSWPHLTHMALYLVTLCYTLYVRLVETPEGALELSSEAVWGMVGFATISLLFVIGATYAAWESRNPSPGNPWDTVQVNEIGENAT